MMQPSDVAVQHQPPRPGPSPWVTMWTRPRATVRRLLDTDPAHMVLVLAALGGISAMLDQATAHELRTAIAWANVPLVVGLVLWVPSLLLIGDEMFTSYAPRLETSMGLAMYLVLVGLASVVLAAWALVLLFKGIGEVQGFSAWKGLGNALLAGLVGLVPIAALGVVAALVIPGLAG